MNVKKLVLYTNPAGRAPFEEWLCNLRDRNARVRIRLRLDRVVHYGHYGDTRVISGGVHELRVHFGPGYRIYFGEDRQTSVILLLGGAKNTQRADIKKALEYWEDCKRRK